MGLGFTWALILISSIREVLGNGTILGFEIARSFAPPLFMILAPGALLTIGLLIGLINHINLKRER